MSGPDANNVPAALIPLLPMAGKWGISNDFERELAVKSASPEELAFLVRCIDNVTDEELFGWLSGSASYDPDPSTEYLVMTCLTMAIDSAKVRLKDLALRME